jgi:maleamate amidohydrolase
MVPSKTERIWDRFLTDQDRKLASFQHPSRVGFGEKPALLLVDLYRAVFGDKPEPLLEAIKTWPNSCGLAGWNTLPSIKKLLSAAREARIPVVYVTGLSREESGVEGWSPHWGERRAKASPEMTARLRRRYEIVDEVKPISGEAVLRKSAPSSFWGTPLVGHLNRLGVDTIVVCGESTSGCVRATVVDGASHRFRMIVVEDCVFDRTESAHALNLFDMSQKYSDVITLDEALRYLQGHHA